MFTEPELRKLQNLVDSDLKASDFFTEAELNAFDSALPLICESLFVPKHNRPMKTLRLKKFFHEKFDLVKTTEKIIKIMKNPIHLQIGVSFLVHCGPDLSTIRYYFAIAQRPINPGLLSIHDKASAEELLAYLSKFTPSDILNLAFDQVNESNAFDKSDFRPRSLVLTTFWITKNKLEN